MIRPVSTTIYLLISLSSFATHLHNNSNCTTYTTTIEVVNLGTTNFLLQTNFQVCIEKNFDLCFDSSQAYLIFLMIYLSLLYCYHMNSIKIKNKSNKYDARWRFYKNYSVAYKILSIKNVNMLKEHQNYNFL